MTDWRKEWLDEVKKRGLCEYCAPTCDELLEQTQKIHFCPMCGRRLEDKK